MNGKLRGAIGILLSIALLVWTLHGIHWSDVVGHLRASNLGLFLLSALAATLIFPLRAVRWQVLLEPVAGKLPLGMLWRSVAIGIAITNVVPARAGELARAYALTKETPRVGFSASFASIAVDRVFDAFVVLSLMLIAMFDPRFPSEALVGGRPASHWLGLGAAIVGAAVVLLYLIVFFPQRLIGWFELFAGRISKRLAARGRDILLAFAGGLGVLKDPRRFALAFLWTLAHWLLNGLAFWIAFLAVGIDAPLSAALLLQGIVAMGVAVPSAPGFFGIFEALAKASLPIYGVSETLAVSWAIGFHLLSFIPITVIGLIYFARLGMKLGELKQVQAQSSTAPAA